MLITCAQCGKQYNLLRDKLPPGVSEAPCRTCGATIALPAELTRTAGADSVPRITSPARWHSAMALASMMIAGVVIGAGLGWMYADSSGPPTLPPPIAAMGDSVLIEYVARLEDGSVVDDSRKRSPVRFRLGDDKVLQGVQRAVIGMRVGQSRQARIPPELAFGEREAGKVVEVGRDRLRGQTELQPGQRVLVQADETRSATASILEVKDASVTLDGNHPLAGRELFLDIRLLEVTKQIRYGLRGPPR